MTTRAAEYEARQKAKGMAKVCVWVPEDYAHKLKAYAEKLRQELEKKR